MGIEGKSTNIELKDTEKSLLNPNILKEKVLGIFSEVDLNKTGDYINEGLYISVEVDPFTKDMKANAYLNGMRFAAIDQGYHVQGVSDEDISYSLYGKDLKGDKEKIIVYADFFPNTRPHIAVILGQNDNIRDEKEITRLTRIVGLPF